MVGEVKKVVVKEELKFFSGFGVGEYICCLDNQGRVWRRTAAADNDFAKWHLIENPQIEQLTTKTSDDVKAHILNLNTELDSRLDRIASLEKVSKSLLDENHQLKVQIVELQKRIADRVMKDL